MFNLSCILPSLEDASPLLNVNTVHLLYILVLWHPPFENCTVMNLVAIKSDRAIKWQAKIGGLYLSVLANWTFQCFPEIKSNPSFISSFFACSFVSLWQPGLVNAIFNVKATIIDSKQKAHLNYRAIEYKTKTKSRQFISFANPINFVFINMIILIKAKICPYLSL